VGAVSRRSSTLLLILAYAAFVSLGLPDTVFGVAWPSLRREFGLSQSSMGAVLATGVCGYFLSGLLAGVMIRKLGVGGLLALSSAAVALALAGYALAPSWTAFFPIGFVMGLGSGAIDSGLNGYAARHFSVRHVNWLHACWGVGASIGPLIMTAAIATGHQYRAGYGALAVLLGTMATAFLLTARAWAAPASSEPTAAPGEARPEAGFGTALASPRVWLHLLAFFVYTGLEASVGQWCFSLMREARGVGVEAAGSWTSGYWASLTLGRIVLGFVIDRFGADRLLRAATFGAAVGATLFAVSSGVLGRAGLLLLGMSLAPMYPTLMARTPARVGQQLLHHAVGFQVSAATLGSSLLPALLGLLVARTGYAAIGALAIVLSLTLIAAHEALLRLKPT
jgi:fucose permease